MCVRVYACAPHFAEVSKIALYAPRAGTQRPEQAPEPERRNTSTGATTTTGTQATTTRAAPKPERSPRRESATKESAPAGTRARAYKKKLQKQ